MNEEDKIFAWLLRINSFDMSLRISREISPLILKINHYAYDRFVDWNGPMMTMSWDMVAMTIRSAFNSIISALKWSRGIQFIRTARSYIMVLWFPCETALNLGPVLSPLKLIEHTAPVKAIAQAPRRHSLVASGGGTTYWCLHFWNICYVEHAQLCGHQESTNIISLIFVVKTFDVIIPGLYGSFSAGLQSSMDDLQVCNLQVWKYPSMSKVDGLVAIDSHTRW